MGGHAEVLGQRASSLAVHWPHGSETVETMGFTRWILLLLLGIASYPECRVASFVLPAAPSREALGTLSSLGPRSGRRCSCSSTRASKRKSLLVAMVGSNPERFRHRWRFKPLRGRSHARQRFCRLPSPKPKLGCSPSGTQAFVSALMDYSRQRRGSTY